MALQTQSQYKKLAEYEDVLWNPDSPVVIERMRLQHDRVYGANVLQITFRNVSQENLYGLSVVISLKDENGITLYEDITYNYYGMEATPNKCFGGDEDIIVEPDAIRFDVSVIRAEYSEGKTFRGIASLMPVPPPQPIEVLGDLAEPFQQRLQELQPKAKLLCAPERKEKYWRCVCKRIYPNHFDKCPTCRIKAEELLEIIPTLKREQRQREAEEARLEAERLAEEQRLEAERLAEEERLRQEEEARLAEEERLRLEEEARRLAEQERLAEEERLRLEREEAQRREEREHKIRVLKTAAPIIAAVILAGTLLALFLPNRSAKPLPSEEQQGEQQEQVDPRQQEQQEQQNIPQMSQTRTMVILGDDLTQADARTIWRLFGISEVELGEHDTVTVSAVDGHRYLDQELGRWNVEDEATSGMLIMPAETGSGLEILTYNITYCSKEMYAEVLAQLGVTDAKVIIAAPYDVSGSTAMAGLKILTGAMPDLEYEVIGHMTAKGSINVRTGPSLADECCGIVPKGTVVSVLEQLDNGWCKIIWQNSDDGFAYTCNTNGRYYTFEPRYGEAQN